MSKYNLSDLDEMTLDQVEKRLAALDIVVRDAETVKEVEAATELKRKLLDRRAELEGMKSRQATAQKITRGEANCKLLETYQGIKGGIQMESESEVKTSELEMRSFQKFISQGARNMTEPEMRSLVLSGSAAVTPIQIMKQLITSEKYSDLLFRATVINEPGAGRVYIPIASNNTPLWHTEATAILAEAAPTLTRLELGGYELLRLMRVSAACYSLSTGDFMDMMLNLLSAEVVEGLEASFITGDGSGCPVGLDELTWTTNTNEILTTNSGTPIAATNIAAALSLLPQKYARKAVLLVNAKTLYAIGLYKGTSEYAYNMADGASAFMGKPIIVNEHVSDDCVYIVDPSQLYVRFAMPITLEADRSSGFNAASIDMRALTVVDAVWNPAACIHVGLGA